MDSKKTLQKAGLRKLKVYVRHFERRYEHIIFPEIRLAGKWLKNAGFTVGKPLRIQHSEKKIVITIDEENNL